MSYYNTDQNSSITADNNRIPKQFGPDGCQVELKSGQKCGEQETLQICRELNEMYADKMREIDNMGGGGDCIEAKVRLQDLWIKDLISQNEELICALERLEYECSQRVTMLESKLTDSVKCGYQVMQKYKDLDLSININKTFQRVRYLENDLNNLIEFIRRVRDECVWSIDGLNFYEVNCAELLGQNCLYKSDQKSGEESSKQLQEVNEELKQKDAIIKELQDQIRVLETKGSEEEFGALKKSMLDMRDALTAEVADKHDVIVTLRRDIQLLEDQCRRADQQTHFKDDIIKELRKEIKHYKQKSKLNSHIPCRSSNFEFKKTTDEKFAVGGYYLQNSQNWKAILNKDDRKQTVKEDVIIKLPNNQEPTKLIKPRSKFTDTKKLSVNYYEKIFEDYHQITNNSSCSYVPTHKYRPSSHLDSIYLSMNARKALYNFDEELMKKISRHSSSKLNNSF